MANQTPINSDEIDLGQFFQMIGKAFNKFFLSFLRFYKYLKKNSILLGALLIVGVAIGIAMNQITTNLMKIEVIVKPNIESRNYLYTVVDEIQANIKAKDIVFFKDLGIDVQNLKGFEITVEPITNNNNDSNLEKEYLELLTEFGVSSEGDFSEETPNPISEIVLAEILSKSTLFNHKISFYFKNSKLGQEYAKKLMTYINSNPYFTELIGVNNQNALKRIEKNTELVAQIDTLISSYAEKLTQKDNSISDQKISFNNQENIDIKGILELKKDFINDIELKKVELNTTTEAINIINFGKPQEVKKAIYGKSIVLIPSLLFGIFFFISIIKYLNRKVKEIEILQN